MGDLQVKTDVLWEAGGSLRHVYNSFKGAEAQSRPSTDDIAHEGLREQLREFADNWDDRREEMMSTIEGLGEAAEAAADAFETLETDFVAALEKR